MSGSTAIRGALGDVVDGVMLELPEPGVVKSLAALKRYEDSLDALVCAWVGRRIPCWARPPLGDDDAAIWCPEDVVRTGKQGQVKQGSFADLSTEIGSSA